MACRLTRARKTENVMTSVEWVLLLCFIAIGFFGCNATATPKEDIAATGENVTGVAEQTMDEITDHDK
jgi:hypothetical protein